MNERGNRFKRWELALLLALCVTLCHGAAFTAPGVAWWGVIFPGLSEPAYQERVETVKLDGGRESGGGEVEVRFRLLEWLEGIFRP